jgi:hypothetical protein
MNKSGPTPPRRSWPPGFYTTSWDTTFLGGRRLRRLPNSRALAFRDKGRVTRAMEARSAAALVAMELGGDR